VGSDQLKTISSHLRIKVVLLQTSISISELVLVQQAANL